MSKVKPRASSVLKNIVSESLNDLRNGDFAKDPRLGDDGQELTGPARFVKGQKEKDEVIIDALLSGIKDKVGYYIKIKKEVRPNEYMLLKTVEAEWRKWADMEVAVAEIVREHTKIAPLKWGTGSYRTEIGCRDGMRGEQYPDGNYYINAEEEFLPGHGMGTQPGVQVIPPADPSVQVAAQIDTLSNLVKMLKDVFPQPTNPAETQNQIASAFKDGMQIKVGESSNNNNMMQAMMTGLIGMMTAVMTNRPGGEAPRVVNPEDSLMKTLEVMKNFGVLGNQQQNPPPKGIVELVTELKAIGVDLFKKDDPYESIGKLKQFASVASELMGLGGGNGEKPGIFDKIIDVIGPAIPQIISDIKQSTGNVVTAQQNMQNMQRSIPIQPQPGQVVQPVMPIQPAVKEEELTTLQRMNRSSGGGGEMPPTPQSQPPVNEQVKAFFSALHSSALNNNKLYYPIVYSSLLQDTNGTVLLNGIVAGTSTSKDLIDMLQSYGDPRFKESEFVMKSLVGYVNGFIVWVQNMAGVQPQEVVKPKGNMNEYNVKCVTCGTVFSYDSESDFMLEAEKTCGQNSCTGVLQPVVGA